MTESENLQYTAICVQDFGKTYLLSIGPHVVEITTSDIAKLKNLFDVVYRRTLGFG